MNWIECKGLERMIVLAVHKHPKSISEISKESDKSIQTISATIERMCKHKIIKKAHEYGKDARRTEIQINYRRIKIKKAHTFFLVYFVLFFIPFISLLILALIFKKFFLLIGASVQALPPLIYILYQAFVKEDKVIVGKNPKMITKNIGGEIPPIEVDTV